MLTELARSQVEVQRCSSGAQLGRSQLEVQRCSLSSEGPRLRSAVPSALRPLQLKSSSAHCVRKLAKSLAKSWQGGSEHGSGGRGGGGEGGGEEQL